MTVALDTNVAIELLRGRNVVVRQQFMHVRDGRERPVISLIVLHELMYGVARSSRPRERRSDVQLLLRDLVVEPLNEADVIASAEVRARLARQGLPIGPYDALIGGQALNRGWTLATANLREFSRVEGLQVVDWTKD